MYKIKINQEETKFLLYPKLYNLVEKYFDIKGLWLPAPKQLLGNLKEVDEQFYNQVIVFYKQENVAEQINIFESILKYIFD